MRCIMCKHGQTEPGQVTISVERAGGVVVIRNVPASVCTTCGEEYLTADVMRELEAAVEQASGVGLDVAVRTFKAA
jgi:YgiT-type zinc finger domain-containing protein